MTGSRARGSRWVALTVVAALAAAACGDAPFGRLRQDSVAVVDLAALVDGSPGVVGLLPTAEGDGAEFLGLALDPTDDMPLTWVGFARSPEGDHAVLASGSDGSDLLVTLDGRGLPVLLEYARGTERVAVSLVWDTTDPHAPVDRGWYVVFDPETEEILQDLEGFSLPAADSSSDDRDVGGALLDDVVLASARADSLASGHDGEPDLYTVELALTVRADLYTNDVRLDDFRARTASCTGGAACELVSSRRRGGLVGPPHRAMVAMRLTETVPASDPEVSRSQIAACEELGSVSTYDLLSEMFWFGGGVAVALASPAAGPAAPAVSALGTLVAANSVYDLADTASRYFGASCRERGAAHVAISRLRTRFDAGEFSLTVCGADQAEACGEGAVELLGARVGDVRPAVLWDRVRHFAGIAPFGIVAITLQVGDADPPPPPQPAPAAELDSEALCRVLGGGTPGGFAGAVDGCRLTSDDGRRSLTVQRHASAADAAESHRPIRAGEVGIGTAREGVDFTQRIEEGPELGDDSFDRQVVLLDSGVEMWATYVRHGPYVIASGWSTHGAVSRQEARDGASTAYAALLALLAEAP